MPKALTGHGAGKGTFGRDDSSLPPLDEAYLWAAVRYVERNPVRVWMEHRAENYRWSSAAAHCGNRSDVLLNIEPGWSKQFTAMDDWSAWLSEGEEPSEVQMLRKNVENGLPCGDASFIQRMGEIVGCNKINRFNQKLSPSSFTHMLIWESVC
jgi:hypothetical protein